MQRKPFLSIDDILESKPIASQYCTTNKEPQFAGRHGYGKQAYRSDCKLGKLTFVSCHSSCCCAKPNLAYRRSQYLYQHYLHYGNLANHLYLRAPYISQPKKRMRASFSHEQVLTLRKVFDRKKYLGNSERMELAKQLKMTEQQIKIWFQNRRYKEKKQQKMEQLLEQSGSMKEDFDSDSPRATPSSNDCLFDSDDDDYLAVID